LIYLAYNQGPGTIAELMEFYGNDPKVLWSRVKMRGPNPKETILAKIETYTKVFA
jgi:hypothetical protein